MPSGLILQKLEQTFDQVLRIKREADIAGMKMSVAEIERHMGDKLIAVNMNKTMSIALLNQYFAAIIQGSGFTDKRSVSTPKRRYEDDLFRTVELLHTVKIAFAACFQSF